MLTKELIERKRNGFQLSRDEIDWFVKGITSGEIGDDQIGAFAMAVFFNGMDNSEKVSFTEAMRDSGEVIEWDLNGLIVDKHSTGGVGDNVSLMLAPALAACGVFVPMISGRGLGHTGGTLDKFDAIPEAPYNKRLSELYLEGLLELIFRTISEYLSSDANLSELITSV